MHHAQVRDSPVKLSRSICTLSTAQLNHLINGYARNGHLNDARKLFDRSPESRNVVSWNSMISGYIKNDQMHYAQDLFDQMPNRDVVSWNTMLAGFQQIKSPNKVIQCFVQMRRIGLKPNEFTFSTVSSAISNSIFKVLIPQLHAQIFCFAHGSCVFVASALMRGYAKLGCQISLRQVFDEISIKDVMSWNALISGYMDLGYVDEACGAFKMMPERNIVSWTTLVTGYICNKNLSEARFNFNKMTERNVVSWTVMINGYRQNGQFIDALELFVLMWKSEIRPNNFTFSSVLSACAGSSSLLMGKLVHLSILKLGLPVDVILSTSLIHMYIKCGEINGAIQIFESMPKKNLVSWNLIIGGYAGCGLGRKAVEEFERMLKDGFMPNQITFLNVLSACEDAGLVEEGERHFMSMETKFGIQAGMEHYACMVDIFGRAGQLEKAEKLIKGMPFEPDMFVWGALLGACRLNSSLELGLLAAEEMYKLGKNHPALYLKLSKIHGDRGVWSSAIEFRKMMKEMRAKEQKAGSWVQSSFIQDEETCNTIV
ncbi:hypothetical protein HHK36_026337 [Tetracentron sinense]|uniref:Pentatricopeptide repeat-containing protein n=1 Tax=Tetracentron sinense TaxID=13715 RepID=A0A834YJ92_TETSI|nr:hypothetical protein HHK36_026337 [Tetracentron sinense]